LTFSGVLERMFRCKNVVNFGNIFNGVIGCISVWGRMMA
jgi:hypothetical protein